METVKLVNTRCGTAIFLEDENSLPLIGTNLGGGSITVVCFPPGPPLVALIRIICLISPSSCAVKGSTPLADGYGKRRKVLNQSLWRLPPMAIGDVAIIDTMNGHIFWPC